MELIYVQNSFQYLPLISAAFSLQKLANFPRCFTALLNDRLKANPELYTKQSAGCQSTLDKSQYNLIREVWVLLKKYQAGIIQEYWLQSGCKLIVHKL